MNQHLHQFEAEVTQGAFLEQEKKLAQSAG